MNNIVLIGMPGSGKTSIGKILSEELEYDFCNIDELLEEREGKNIGQIFKIGEEYFRDMETRTIEEMNIKRNTIIATGGGVVEREKNMEILKDMGKIIFIDRPIKYIIKDIDLSRELFKDDRDRLYNIYDKRIDRYMEYSDYRIKNDSGIKDIIEKIKKII